MTSAPASTRPRELCADRALRQASPARGASGRQRACASSRSSSAPTISSTASAPDATASSELILSDDEVLAQQRHGDCRADLREVIEAAVEERRLGQHRNRRRARRCIGGRVRGRIVVLAQDALRRRPPLALGDDPRRRRRAQRVTKGLALRPARVLRAPGSSIGVRRARARGRVPRGGDDRLEQIGARAASAVARGCTASRRLRCRRWTTPSAARASRPLRRNRARAAARAMPVREVRRPRRR